MSIERFANFLDSKTGKWTLGILIGSGVASFVLLLIAKMKTGHGLDYYITGKGVQFNYIGAFIAIIVSAVALLVSWLIRRFKNKRKAKL